MVPDHPFFARRDKDLTLRVPVTVAEATLGAVVTIPTLTDAVAVRIPAGTPEYRPPPPAAGNHSSPPARVTGIERFRVATRVCGLEVSGVGHAACATCGAYGRNMVSLAGEAHTLLRQAFPWRNCAGRGGGVPLLAPPTTPAASPR